jgi:hypothetical protein
VAHVCIPSYLRGQPGWIVCETPPSPKITRVKMNWRCGSNSRAPASTRANPWVQTQVPPKIKIKKKNLQWHDLENGILTMFTMWHGNMLWDSWRRESNGAVFLFCSFTHYLLCGYWVSIVCQMAQCEALGNTTVNKPDKIPTLVQITF